MATLKEKLVQSVLKVEGLKQQLSTAEKEMDALYKQATTGRQKKNNSSAPDVDIATVDTSADMIASLLKSNPTKVWDYDDILQELPSIPRASIRVFLYQLQKEEKVSKAGRGKWKAA